MKFRLKSFLIAIVLLFGFMGFGFSQVTQDSKADELPSSLGALFSQASVNPESMREVVDLRKNSPTTQAMVVWYVTLLFLTFAAAADFYRHRMSTDDVERAEDFDELESVEWESDEEDPQFEAGEFKRNQTHSAWIRRLLILPPLLITTFWIISPFIGLVLSPPEGMGIRRFAMLMFIALLCAGIVMFACAKITILKRLFGNGWLGIGFLFAIRFFIYIL